MSLPIHGFSLVARLRVRVRSTSIVVAIQCGVSQGGDHTSFDCELTSVATLGDALIDPGAIALPPSLNRQDRLRLGRRVAGGNGRS